ncbi:MAG TPA: TonB-dependent receptor plug domain-containing protein, partial [Ferruginibacter sp.]|nr:TonB-dependent receptor plug domain-containing protein [Ferruginibacter sp.]
MLHLQMLTITIFNLTMIAMKYYLPTTKKMMGSFVSLCRFGLMARMMFLLLISLCTLTAVTQNKNISGRVTAANNQPLQGVSVLVKGTSVGTSTDANGMFSISAAPGATLVFSYVGATPQEVIVGENNSVNLSFASVDEAMTEVVVIGYQTVRKKDLTGAVGVVNPAAANRNISNTVAESIQGLVAGVTVRNTGTPGGAAKIDIRGAGTFAGNNPLYIVDGMYTDATPDFNPQDIESIQILKDASAAAIYGSRAANGVIIVTTKKGRQGPLAITGSIKSGIQKVS